MGKKKLSKRAISDLDFTIITGAEIKDAVWNFTLQSTDGNPVSGVNSSCHQACQTVPLQTISYENNNAAGSQEKNPAAIAPGTTCKEQPTNSLNSIKDIHHMVMKIIDEGVFALNTDSESTAGPTYY